MYENFMNVALKQAGKAAKIKEVPIGAIIVKNNKIISKAYNKRESKKNALYHAEILAIEKACKKLKSWRLSGCEIYITLEPCPMCMGAIINSRIDKVIFGAYDPKAGSCGSVINLNDYPYNHHPEIIGGILKEDCSKILTSFFASLRKEKKH